MNTTHLWIGVAGAMLLAACEGPPQQRNDAVATSKPAEIETPAATTEVRAKISRNTEALMKEHFAQALTIRKAVIAGKLEDVAKPAQWFVEFQDLSRLHDKWRPHMSALMESAKIAKEAKNMKRVAGAVASMGQSCGACHASEGGPKIEFPSLPKRAGKGPHMEKHEWALERLWDGLVGPSDEAWKAGAEGLADAPLTQAELEPSMRTAGIDTLAKQVHALGAEAATADAVADRVRVYGELLATCSACHEALEVTVE